MIKRVLIVVVVLVLIGLVVVWLIGGGASAVAKGARALTNPVALIFGNGTSTGISIRLPWQLDPVRGPDISQFADQADQQLAQIPADEADQGQSSGRSDILQFGVPSPYVGAVTISFGEARARNPAEEYIELTASYGNTSPIVVSGWSLQSVVTGVRAYLPEGAPTFVMGIVNNVGPVSLAVGDSAIVTSGVSPVGVSFQENICSGYLGQFSSFVPEISDQCPAPSDMLPETADNLRVYGASCFDYLASLPHCHFPGTQLPSSISTNCGSYVVNTLSYNGCVHAFGTRDSFRLPTWRIFLNRTTELWNNSHDIVRLIDAQGRTVDVLTY